MEAVIAQMAINDNDGRPPFFVSHSGADRDIVDIIVGVLNSITNTTGEDVVPYG
jgi:hypothetical protein